MNVFKIQDRQIFSFSGCKGLRGKRGVNDNPGNLSARRLTVDLQNQMLLCRFSPELEGLNLKSME